MVECALGKVEGLSGGVGVFVLRAVSKVGYIGLVSLGLLRKAHNEPLDTEIFRTLKRHCIRGQGTCS